MFVQGCGMASYDIDWAVISGINAYPAWNTYFGVASSGITFGTINALMNIGNFRETPFMSLADTIGRRGIKFVGNAIVIAKRDVSNFTFIGQVHMDIWYPEHRGLSIVPDSDVLKDISVLEGM